MIPRLRTQRLDVRPCTLDDIDMLHAMWTDPDVRRYLWDDQIIERDQAEQVVQALVDSAANDGCGMWVLYLRDSNDAIGFVALRAIEGTVEVELLYGLYRTAWGSGYATEASLAVLSYGFEQVRLARIWARTDPPNVASIRVIERLQMQAAENPGSETIPIAAWVLERPR